MGALGERSGSARRLGVILFTKRLGFSVVFLSAADGSGVDVWAYRTPKLAARRMPTALNSLVFLACFVRGIALFHRPEYTVTHQ
jgi:hypothetical protein